MDYAVMLGGLLGIGLLILLLRNVALWYWKVNVLVRQQRETNRLLGRISRKLDRLMPEEEVREEE